MPVDGDPAAHVTSYQEAVSHLATAGFDIPAFVTAAILLSTLPSEPGDPDSWNQFVAGIKIDKTTTLSTIVNAILEEKRRCTEPSVEGQSGENALAAKIRDARHHRRSGPSTNPAAWRGEPW
ncbi:hypothetical protein GLOTRDRAFT_126878 [Gloeophyllum trabeum ATCC 11539]|uniref:Uncharacterized protein n=1 Tax=Gloeophyllum trabeum (strain ATCC 11539 / FP-39264 / Madison 617) TaxID=670483 RepID=S7RUH0_GLOTA|nr:uncharacterized protein GLOTRDRAFT_126878 [Gloeophyllum trabeum ATCC 11539]EPQ58385.1 hypothetical protein GLOTRDRAFT_126878 [Gloeophyllum trabeum ATCC 11539]